NDILLPIFPADLKESGRKQRLFLGQFFGGPKLYLKERARPMLPDSHKTFGMTPARRDAGLNCMKQDLINAELAEPHSTKRLFLAQFFGGPKLYLKERGRPMLPDRHKPFEITPARRDAWLNCMKQALIDAEIPEPYFTKILGMLTIPAQNIVKAQEDSSFKN